MSAPFWTTVKPNLRSSSQDLLEKFDQNRAYCTHDAIIVKQLGGYGNCI
jgi:hypothetical protein